MSIKSLILASSLALTSQAAIANKPLPCPTTGPVQDTTNIIRGDIATKIDNRLRNIETEKKHQVVVITVNNLEEYGFGSIQEMSNKIGNGCKVGFRGENTGVVVLYTQVPSRYRIENAGTERYITDAHSGRILAHSKSDGVCNKEDVSCRLDDITNEIDKVIRVQFPDKQAVQEIQGGIEKHDKEKSSQTTSNILNTLGVGAVVIVVLGGGAWGVTSGVSALKRNSRRKAIKKEILEFAIRLQVEKQKYPDWFQSKYIQKTEVMVQEMSSYSDTDIDTIIGSDRHRGHHIRKLAEVNSSMNEWAERYSSINEEISTFQMKFIGEGTVLMTATNDLIGQGFKFAKIDIPKFQDGANPIETLTKNKKAFGEIEASLISLRNIPEYYKSIAGFGIKLSNDLEGKKTEYTTISSQYEKIYGTNGTENVSKIDEAVRKIVQEFRVAYTEKDIDKIRAIVSQSEGILSPIKRNIQTMSQKITWYNGIPNEIATRNRKIQGIKPNHKYIQDATAYMNKTGKRNFLNYNIEDVLSRLVKLLGKISEMRTDKNEVNSIPLKLAEFDKEYNHLQEYIGLGSALAAIIATEVAEELRRKREAEERAKIERNRRIQEEEEEENRNRRAQEAENERKRSANSGDDTSNNGWGGGGGGGFSGGGAESD